MIDVYTMILWARPKECSIEYQAALVFNILMTLKKIDYLNPKYETVYRKKDAVEFDLTLENVKALIERNTDKQFPDLGSLIGFFTSLNDDESAGISISIGVSNLKFVNSIVISLNWDYKKMCAEKYDELEWLFKELIIQFKPFYGFIASKSNKNKYDEYYDDINNKPVAIFDMNFWSNEIIKGLKINDKILLNFYEHDEIGDGIFTRLLKEPFNILDPKHIELQNKVSKMMKLHRKLWIKSILGHSHL